MFTSCVTYYKIMNINFGKNYLLNKIDFSISLPDELSKNDTCSVKI